MKKQRHKRIKRQRYTLVSGTEPLFVSAITRKKRDNVIEKQPVGVEDAIRVRGWHSAFGGRLGTICDVYNAHGMTMVRAKLDMRGHVVMAKLCLADIQML
jgi:hypothetical protein